MKPHHFLEFQLLQLYGIGMKLRLAWNHCSWEKYAIDEIFRVINILLEDQQSFQKRPSLWRYQWILIVNDYS